MIDGRDRINSNPYSYYGSDLELKYIFEFMAESELKGSKRAYLQYRSYNEIDFEKIDSLIKTYDESIRITVLVKDYNLISLSNNISANIAFDWILNNPFIEELFIIAPKLRELGKVDINMFDLEELVIYSPLTCLPDSFCKLQSLRRIEFFCPFFKQVPMQIFDLGHLEEITFFGSDSLILDVTEDKKGTSLRLEIIYIISSKDFEIKKSFFNNLEDVWVNISDCKNVKIESSRMKRKNSIRVLKYR